MIVLLRSTKTFQRGGDSNEENNEMTEKNGYQAYVWVARTFIQNDIWASGNCDWLALKADSQYLDAKAKSVLCSNKRETCGTSRWRTSLSAGSSWAGCQKEKGKQLFIMPKATHPSPLLLGEPMKQETSQNDLGIISIARIRSLKSAKARAMVWEEEE